MYWTEIIAPGIEFRKSDQVFDHTGRVAVSEVNLILEKIQYRLGQRFQSVKSISPKAIRIRSIKNGRFQILFRKSVKFLNFDKMFGASYFPSKITPTARI